VSEAFIFGAACGGGFALLLVLLALELLNKPRRK